MERKQERRLFPGNNTSLGFYSYYQYILPQREANHIYCLKGGPGVGKSTFMKNIGGRMRDEGFGIEYFHCSSDPDSLDGVVIPKLRAAVIDGTAPHVIDPQNPGAVDEIINLGDYWDADAIKKYRDEIMHINAEVGRLFGRAYRYLAAAGSVMDAAAELIDSAADKSGPWRLAQEIIEEHMRHIPVAGKPGKVRKLFASAITPKGVVAHIDTLFDGTFKVYCIKSHWGVGVSALLERVFQEAHMRGLDTEVYYCPMKPQTRIEHLLIPAIGLAFVSENRYVKPGRQERTVLDLACYTDRERIDKDAMEADTRHFDALLAGAICALSSAKQKHDAIEQYYIPHMDFEKANKRAEDVCRALRRYARRF